MEYLIDIPGRLNSVAIEKHIAGTDQIYDDFLKTTLDVLNLENITDVKVQDGNLQFLNIQGLVLKEISIASGTQKQSDWNLTDSTQVDFIKNKPTVYNKLEVDDKLTTKQDTINDLATIRSGAQAGATAYQKPQTGIPATDLASAVQVSLGKADTALQEHQSLAGLVNTGSYNTVSKKIELKHDNTVLAEIDATAFIKDGMVSSVTINNGYLVITFNTDAGKEPISIALTDIFNPANYYTKSQVDSALSGKLDVRGSNYSVSNGVIKINGLQDQYGTEYIRNGMHLLQGLKIYYYDYETTITGEDIVVHSKGEQEDGSVSLRTLANKVAGKADSADLAEVATSGSYNDLTDKPTIPAAQVQSDWNESDTTSKAFIRNKPTIPTVPTNVSAFNNDAGYITAPDVANKQDKMPIVQVASGTTAINAAVNTYYEVAGDVGTLAITLPTPTDLTKVSMVVVHLTAGTTPNVVIGSAATVDYSSAYDISAGKEYEINCMFNGGKWVVADMEVV